MRARFGLFLACMVLCGQFALNYNPYHKDGVKNGESIPQDAGRISAVGYAGNPILSNLEHHYDTHFGKNWKSIRTFRLITPLNKPLKVYIETNPRDRRLFKPEYAQFVKKGLDAWSEALDGRLRYTFVDNPSDAQIRIGWVASFPDKYTAGEAVYKVGDARIQIKTIGVPMVDIQTNIMHELGHALGIADHSPNPGDIMVAMRRWKTNNNYQPKLSHWDKMAIRRLYSLSWNKGEDLYQAVKSPDAVLATEQ